MRLLFLSNIEKTLYSGMGRWTHHICDELRLAGHQVDEWYADAFPNVRSALLRHFAIPPVIAYRVWKKRKEYDFVFLHEPSAWVTALLARAFQSSMPAIVAVSHGVETHARAEYAEAAKRGYYRYTKADGIKHKLFRNWASDLGLKASSMVLCLSSSDSIYLRDILGIAPQRILQIDNGINPETDLPTAHDVVRDRRRVLFLSAWRDYKGIQFLPELWKAVLTQCPDAQLLLVGTGAQEEEVLSHFNPDIAASLKVIPVVHDRRAVQQLMQSAGIFLMPSIFEGSPLAMIEAMACGLAIVGSDAGGIPDLLGQGRYGRVFAWRQPERGAEMVVELLQDTNQQQSLSRLSEERARELTWHDSARPILVMLEQAKLGFKA